MPDLLELEDHRWLVSEAAKPWLADAPDRGDWLRVSKRLRKHLSTERAQLVADQLQLRTRARRKFSCAESMFFTRVGLEQATDERIAQYKADRLSAFDQCLDICCGIGGDLISLAARRPTIGLDRDPRAALFAAANLRATCGEAADLASVRCEEADVASVAEAAAWHIDPDRRPGGQRTVRLTQHEPDGAWIEAALRVNGDAAIKIAPAAVVPDSWSERAELEWVSTHRECRQLIAWFGATTRETGFRKATIVTPDGPFSLVGRSAEYVPTDAKLGKYLVEPDAAVLAAGLDAVLANELSVWRFDDGGAYLTGDRAVESPLAECFEIVDVLPLAVRPLKQALAARDIGRLEIKKRGVSISPESLRQKLALCGTLPAILVATPLAGRQVALLVKRVEGC